MNATREEKGSSEATGTKDGAPKGELKRWEKILATARQLMCQNEFGKTLSHFAYAIHHAPELRDEVHDDFLFAMKSWCHVLEQHGKLEDIVKCLNEARNIYPNSATILNNIGSALFRLNLFDEAAVYFRRALAIEPGLSSARENLDSLANLLVERWHFRMLNDEVRNRAYRDAIGRAVNAGCDHVLDIGSGTGILSMYAVQAGAKHVFACEMSKTMFELSGDILAANGMRDSIHVINKKSCDLEIPGDLPTHVSLVVTETLDCGLLGEGILETLTHARRELMTSEGGWCADSGDIQETCRDIQEPQRDMQEPRNDTEEPQRDIQEPRKDTEEPQRDMQEPRRDTEEPQRDMQEPHRGTEEPQRDMQESQRDHKTLAKVIPAGATVYGKVIESAKIREYFSVKPRMLDFDLGCVNIKGAEVSEKAEEEPYTTEDMSCVKHTPLSEPFHLVTYDFRTPEKYTTDSTRRIKVPVSNAGSVDAVMTWFELKLDEVETISSAPGRSVCWEQAVYPLGKGEIRVEAGDEVVLACMLTSGAIFVEMDHVVREQSVIEREDEKLEENYVLPFSEVSKLNDVRFNESFQNAILGSFAEIRSSKQVASGTGNYGCLVLCDSPTFSPLFASAAGFAPVLCVSSDTDFANCLEVLRAHNRIPDTVRFTNRKLEELAQSGRWDVLVVDPVEPSGVLRRQVVEDVVFAKGCILPADTGVIVPRKIELWGMLISSDSLCRKSHVINDDVTLGLDIARHVNTFQVNNQIDVNVDSNPYVAHTQPIHLMTLDFTTSSDDDVTPLALLEVTRVVDVTAERSGDVDGLMYWFVLDFSEQSKLSTGPESASRFNQVVIVFKEHLHVSRGEQLLVTSSCKNSCVSASVQHSPTT